MNDSDTPVVEAEEVDSSGPAGAQTAPPSQPPPFEEVVVDYVSSQKLKDLRKKLSALTRELEKDAVRNIPHAFMRNMTYEIWERASLLEIHLRRYEAERDLAAQRQGLLFPLQRVEGGQPTPGQS